MLFGVAKAIAREESLVQNYDVLIFDLSDVPMLGVTASLAIENAIKDSLDIKLNAYQPVISADDFSTTIHGFSIFLDL